MLRAPGKLCSFSYVLFVFFLLFYVLDVVSITVYDRDTLLNIGSSVAQRKPDFEFLNAGGLFTDTTSEPFVWVVQLWKRRRRRKRGKPEAEVFVYILITCGVMKGTYSLLNPSAPLIWNFIRFCVDHSGYRGNLQRS